MQASANLCYSDYHKAIHQEMLNLADDPKVLFVGQQVVAQDFYGTLEGVPLSKRIEMPVAEEMQMGFCIGLSLEGYLPVCIFQRIDFMYRAMDSLCNHLDLLPKYSRGVFMPKVIIRTTIGNNYPIDPGMQHTKNLINVFKSALSMPVFGITTSANAPIIYNIAKMRTQSTMIVEYQRSYWA